MKIEIKDSKSVIIDDVEYVRKEETLQGKVKIGAWYRHKDSDIIFRVCRVEGFVVYYDNSSHMYTNYGQYSTIFLRDHCRLAKYNEIESHLVKESKRRGFKQGVKFRIIGENSYGIVSTFSSESHWWYDIRDDKLHCSSPEGEWSDHCCNPTYYRRGQWAEIIHDKKPIPKTREEFKIFMDDMDTSNVLLHFGRMTTDEFLDQYDFD